MEDYTPVIPNPPPPSFQEHHASLGSSSAGPAHYYQQWLPSRRRHHEAIIQPPTSATISEGDIGREQNLVYLPSSSQQAALTALQDYDNKTVFAWLHGLRSLRRGAANWFQPGCLSPQELEAISALEECSDNLVSAWLDSTRCSGNRGALHGQHGNSYFDGQRAPVTSTRSTLQRSSHTSKSSASSFGAPASLCDNRTSGSTQCSSFSGGSFLDLSGDPAIDETAATLPGAAGHTHWCFVCENHRVYTTCDGWKRHMKEHETRYPCMPRGREIDTAHGPECVLCGHLDPDERHYNLHNIQPCSNKSLAARSYTRRIHLINHLKTHGISDGSALAEEWRDTLDKKYFSCGFCIAYFHSHADQLNHIHDLHYKNHQHISAWDSNKVILGLLLQPGVYESWRNVLAVHAQFDESRFRWSAATVKNLQLRLQKSNEPAGNLALAAFNECTDDWTQETHGESMSVADFSNQDVSSNHGRPTIRGQALPAQMLFGPDQGTMYDRGMTTPPLRGQHPALRSITTHHPNPSVPNTNPMTYQNNSSRRLLTTDRTQDPRDVQLGLSSSSSNGWAPLGSSHHVPIQSSIPTPSDTYDGQSSAPMSLAGHGDWHASSSPMSPSAYFGRQDNSGAGRTRTTAATHNTASDFDYLTSPLARSSSSFRRSDPSSMPIRPTNQPSSTKLKDYYDIDTGANMVIDLNDIQYYMREEAHTRSEGGRN